MTISAEQQTELEKPAVNAVYFGEFSFAGGTARLSTWNTTITWGGHDWSGLGQLISIDAIEESKGLSSRALRFGLTAAEDSWIALAVGAPEECRGRSAKLYFCPVNQDFQKVGTPELCWQGTMDPPIAGINEDGEGQIILNCQTSSYGLRRLAQLRMNHEQQKQRMQRLGLAPDTGFMYLNDLIANPQLWASKRLQRSLS